MHKLTKKPSTTYYLPSTKYSKARQTLNEKSESKGFTIVELLVVIVVIGILAAITIVSYTGISDKATAASIQSDLTSAKKQLNLYYVDHGSYPASIDGNNCPVGSSPSPDTRYCLKPSSGNSFTYLPNSTTIATDYSLYVSNSGNSSLYYRISNNSAISSALTKSCPYGFIVVPGSSTYGTSDFCVMKYEAKQVGSSTTPISQASGLPWVSISQTAAIANSSNVIGCTGCHLITETEWLTIAQNVLNNPINWSSGTVGTGYIYSGHNDNAPSGTIDASTNDSDGYYGTGNSSSSGANQKRTLALSNGEIIWDLAGNAYEWTQGTAIGNQPGVLAGGYAWRNYTEMTTHGTLSPDPFPATTGITGASSWTGTNGIGFVNSSADDASSLVVIRGGNWSAGNIAGVFMMLFTNTTGHSPYSFRVTR